MTTSKTTLPGARPRVYSYIRFSTPEQALGDSERRQLALAKAYADKAGLPFDESLRMTDRGLSGYHGTHRKKGALGAFLTRVEAGDVPAGSTLVVENLDRLSREDFLDAFEVIRSLIGKGISIHTLSPEATYDRQSLNSHAIYQLVGQMMLAHEESVKKAERLSAAWSEKRKRTADRVILTRRCPAWLRVKGGAFEVIPAAAKAIQAIFDLKLKGIGKNVIAAKLNAGSYWSPPRNPRSKTEGWRPSYITKILSSRAVIGEYQPHVIVSVPDPKQPDESKRIREPSGEVVSRYFPPVIASSTFYAVQKRLKANNGTGGRTGKATNLFTGLTRCAYCGGPMHLVSKGRPPKGGAYLICDAGRRGVGCRAHAIRYDEVETTVLENCRRLRPDAVLPKPGEQAARIDALRQNLTAIDGQLADIQTRTTNLVDQIERTPNPQARERYEARMTGLDAQVKQLTEQRKTVQADLDAAEAAPTSFNEWKRTLVDLRQALDSGEVDVRLRMRTHLKELIDRIEIWAVGFTRAYDPDAKMDHRNEVETIGDSFEGHATDGGFKLPRGFSTWVTKQAMSKRGRFLRVYFKSGARLQLVPKGSIASGMALRDGQWVMVQPELEPLLREFRRVKP